MIGQNIKTYLNSNGIKQSYLANKLSMPSNKLSNLLNDKTKITAVEYFAICQALNVPLDFFKDEKARKEA